MPRINVEETIWSDSRFLKLCILVGCEYRAIGLLVWAWRLAQNYVPKGPTEGQEMRGIPEPAWDRNEYAEAIIRVGLARRVDGFIQVAGAKNAFDWLNRVRRGASKGGEAKARNHREKSLPLAAPSCPSLPSLSLSFSNNETTKELQTNSLRDAASPDGSQATVPFESGLKESGIRARPDRPSVREYVAAMVRAWSARWPNERPELGGKEQGILKRVAKSYSAQRFSELYQAYLQCEDEWFKKKGYDLATFEQNLQKIATALARGQTSEIDAAFARVRANIEAEKKQKDQIEYEF